MKATINKNHSAILIIQNSNPPYAQTMIAESTWDDVYERFKKHYEGWYILYKIEGKFIED